MLGEGRPAREADLGPLLVGQRLGGDHQGVDRHDRPPVTRQPRGVALGGAHDDVGADRAVVGVDRARLDREDAGALVDPAAAPLDRTGEPAHEPERVDGRAVGGVRRPEGVGDRARWSRVSAGSSSRSRPRRGPTPGVRRPRRGRAAAAPRVRATMTVPPLAQWASMPSASSDPPDLVDARRASRRAGPARPPAPTPGAGQPVGGIGKSAEHQPPLRPEAPKPAVSASSTTTRSVGSAREQVVGGPEPGEAGADDGDVAVGVRRQRRPRGTVCRRAVPPRGSPLVASLSARPTSRSACAA